MAAAARRQLSGTWRRERRRREALKRQGLATVCSAPCTSAKVASCRRDAEEDGALGRRKEFDASTRVTHACTEAAALPTSQMKHCVCADDVLRAAGGEKLYQERRK